ncbi:MAG TPA: hemolysin family protein [Planctomycetaceae bacterium]|nr:hemolysin family protein [Planctomycetaceae bacterium]
MIGLPLLVVFLLALVSWAAFGCYALTDYSYSRLEELCERKGVIERFQEILRQQDLGLLGMQVLQTLSTLGLAIAAVAWIGVPVEHGTSALLKSFGQYTLSLAVTVFFADLLPWTVARVASEPFLFRFWPIMRVWLWILWPVLVFVRQADRYAHRMRGRGDPQTDDKSVIGEEILTVVDEGRREGLLEQNAGQMIERVMDFQHENVGAIMTPRIDMICIQVDASLDDARRELIEAGHSRVPIIGDSTDDILGILYAKDLLKALEPRRAPQDPIPVLRDIIRDPVYIPTTTPIPKLLDLMRREHVQIAIVNDEYGGVAGLVTMEDIIEEIVGEIADEYDDEQPPEEIVVVSETTVDVDGRVHIDDLNARFEFQLPEDQGFDTIGGFVFSLIGRMPAAGETTEWNGLRMTVLAADPRTIERLRIERVVDSATENATATAE